MDKRFSIVYSFFLFGHPEHYHAIGDHEDTLDGALNVVRYLSRRFEIDLDTTTLDWRPTPTGALVVDWEAHSKLANTTVNISLRDRSPEIAAPKTPAEDLADRLRAVGVGIRRDTELGLLDRFWVEGTDINFTFSPVPLRDGEPYGLNAVLVAHDGRKLLMSIASKTNEFSEDEMQHIANTIISSAKLLKMMLFGEGK